MNLNGKTILAIDDDQSIHLILKRIFENVGASCHFASNVMEGVQLAQKYQPHVVICDLNMEPKSGFDLIKISKKIPALADIPIIVLSGLKDKTSVGKALAFGAKDYLVKPLDAKVILRRVYRHCQNHNILKKSLPAPQKAQAKIAGTLYALGESTLEVELPMRFNRFHHLKIESSLLEELGFGDVKLKTKGKDYKYTTKGHYLNSITFVGITESDATQIRKTVKSWGQ